MAEITTIESIIYSSHANRCLLTSNLRLQKLPLQQNLRQHVQRLVIPAHQRPGGQAEHSGRLHLRVLLHSDPFKDQLLFAIQLCQASLHVVDKDHHVVEPMHLVVGHLPPEHLPSQQRRSTPSLHRHLHVSPKQPLRVLPVEGQLRSSLPPPLPTNLRNLTYVANLVDLMESLSSPDHRQNQHSCAHRPPPTTPTPAWHRETRVNRDFRPALLLPRGAGNSDSRCEHPRQ